MAVDMTDASKLAQEYGRLVRQTGRGKKNGDVSASPLQTSLVSQADWTPAAAAELEQLARQYGSFMLRNALALAVALNIEDGAKGL